MLHSGSAWDFGSQSEGSIPPTALYRGSVRQGWFWFGVVRSCMAWFGLDFCNINGCTTVRFGWVLSLLIRG